MSNVIEFLARMGAEADLRDAGKEALARELAEANVDGELADFAAQGLSFSRSLLEPVLAAGQQHQVVTRSCQR